MSVWKSDETLLSICILNFSFKNDFVWEEISNIRHSVSSPDETPRSSSKILRCASYFQLSSRCFIWWWNTASHVWYITYLYLKLFHIRLKLSTMATWEQKKVAAVKGWPSLRGFKQETEHSCNVLRWLNAPSCTRTNRVMTVRWLCGTVVSPKAKLLWPPCTSTQAINFLFSLLLLLY